MIIHNNSDAALYFAKGLDFVSHLPEKKSLFVKKTKDDNREVNNEILVTFIADTRKESIDFVSEMIVKKQKAGVELNKMLVVIVDYFKDSMIRSKYIQGKLLRGNKTKLSPSYIFVEFNEADKIIQIEDEYNQCFSYKDLSRGYKRQLLKVNEIIKVLDTDVKIEGSVNRSKSSKKGGSDIANSSLV